MAKLNQIIAVEKGIKARVYGEITTLHKASQKPELFNGFSKTYEKVADDGEELPPEGHRVQFVAGEVMRASERLLTELMDVTARKDWTNCDARGSVAIDGKVLLDAVPVSYLLFLEKQLTDLRTFIGAIPVLDEAHVWNKDSNDGLFKTDAIKTHRTKKVQKPIVLYDATAEHPAQTQLISEDVIAGHWVTVKQSGAMPKTEKQALLERVEKLLRAVKEAREEANVHDEVTPPNIGAAIFGYLQG